MTTSFQRARSAEQRAARRAAILATARGMLGELRVSELSLNELARRSGLAKSNVLRYFESREAILLEVYDQEYGSWLDAVESAVDGVEPADVEEMAAVLAAAAAERPMLCELSSSAAGVLEQNLSADVAVAYKLAASAHAVRLGALAGKRLELTPAARLGLSAAVNLGIGGTWAATRRSPGMAAAYDRHPELRVFRLEFETALREYLATVLTGLMHRDPRVPADAVDLEAISRALAVARDE